MIKESLLNTNQAVRYEEVLAGDYWMQPLLKNQTLRIVDLHGNQAADTLFYSVADPAERYSAIDTIREQKNVYLTAGTTLLTNMGNPMLTITADTCVVTIRWVVPVLRNPTPCDTHWKRKPCMPVVTAGCWRSLKMNILVSANAISPITLIFL